VLLNAGIRLMTVIASGDTLLPQLNDLTRDVILRHRSVAAGNQRV
jgi:hypothetical protein